MNWNLDQLYRRAVVLGTLALVGSVGQAAVELRVGNVAGVPGARVRVPIQIASDTPVVGLQFDFVFPPASLLVQAASGGPALADHAVDSNEVALGVRRVLVFSPANAPLGNGVLVEMPLTISTNAALGPIALILSNVVVGDGNGEAIPGVTLVAGQLTVGPTGDSGGGIQGMPYLTALPQSRKIQLGSSFAVTVSVDGVEPLFYQWRLNGVNLPGATNATYSIDQAELADSGSYSVVVANRSGATTSAPFDIVIDLPASPSGDQFADRTSVGGPNGVVASNTRLATREPGEPKHGGKQGGKSVWFTWRAPATGIASFRTTGSTFDSLLGVYTGNAVNTLVPVAGDDDGGGYLTSQARFNATAGTDYQIAVDGFAGAEGELILSWELQSTGQVLPVIAAEPSSQTTVLGADVQLRVQAAGNSLSYQWFFNGAPIPGSTSPVLSKTRLQNSDVGSYAVQVTTSALLSVESLPAYLEIVERQREVSQDKLEDLWASEGAGTLLSLSSALRPAGSPSVSIGTIGSQLLNNWGAGTQPGETNPWPRIGGASRWLRLTAAQSGLLLVDTVGSQIDTLLAVYTGTGIRNLTLVASDDNGASDGVRSALQFAAQAQVEYLICADGVNGQQGLIQVNWQLVEPERLSYRVRRDAGPFEFQVSTVSPRAMVLESTSDFRRWLPIFTNQAANLRFEFADPPPGNAPLRFYRARAWP